MIMICIVFGVSEPCCMRKYSDFNITLGSKHCDFNNKKNVFVYLCICLFKMKLKL